ncbi:MAG: PAS domain-containing protein [Aquaticitalea sp.]
MSNTNKAYNFLQGGGDMGQLIRSTDWSKTPLGPPDTWPQSLKTMVDVMLDNPFGLNIVWGKDFTQIYNDAYRPILGSTKHPQALGSSAKETWSEIWHIIGPMFEVVLEGESVRFSDMLLQLNRNGYLEDCYFDFAYSPIRLENGEVGGALVTAIETTTKKEAQDDLIESKDELEFVIEAAQLGIFDYNPMTNEFSGNARLKDWFGLPTTEDIELVEAINAICDKDRERITKAIQNVLEYESGGKYDVRYTIVNAITTKETHVHAKGRVWFNDDQQAYRFTGTLEDITEQTIANKKSKETEQHIQTMVLESPVGICVLDAETLVGEIVNDSYLEITGRTREAIVGHYYWDTFAEAKSLYQDAMQKVIETGEVFYEKDAEVMLLRHGKEEIIYVTFSYAPLTDENNKVVKIAVWAFDNSSQVEARKTITVSETNLRLMILQAPVAIAIFRGADYQIEIANKFALQLWGRTEQQVLNIPLFEAMPELLSQGFKDFLDDVSKTGNRFATHEMPVNIVRNDSLEIVYINFSFEALYDEDGVINGIMAIGIDVTSQVESRKKIEESEQSIRALVESAPFPIGVFTGENMRITLANQSIMNAWGKGNDVVGKLYTDILPELGNQHIFEQIREVLYTGIPFHAKNQKVDIAMDGQLKTFFYNYSFTPLMDTSGNTFAVMNTAADLTELHEAKHKVEESEKRFRDSVKQAPFGIAIVRGPEHIVEMANENYLLLVDRSEAEFLNKPLFESLPEVEETIAPIIADIYKTGDAFYGYEFPVAIKRHGKTETSYFNFVYHPLEENNVITGVMAVATEVTATVEAKHLIVENEEKLKLIIEASELGVYDVNLKSGELVASDRCHEILGFPNERNLRRENIIINLHPDDLNTRKIALEKAYKSGSLHYQSRVIWKDQTIHWMDTKGKLFYDANNEPERILGTIRDITEERNFHQELLEREQKFRLLADSMPQFIWTSDPEGKLNYFNKSVFEYSGFTSDDIETDGWIQIVHPEDREENIEQWIHAITTGTDFLLEHRFRKHTGEYRWQLSRAIPQRDKEGVIKMWVGTSTDIQDQKMFTTELEKMVQQRTTELEQTNLDLEKMNKELQSFVYISSHDLQEPLRKIQTFASRINETEYETLSDTAKRYFSRMQNSAHRMQNLIQDLISYSRTSVQDNQFDIVDLQEIIDDVKETLSEELEQNEVIFKLSNIQKVRMITVQFKQVILNLMTNSIKFSKINQPIIIEIDCKLVEGKKTGIEALVNDKNYCLIRFSDNGIGFEPQYTEKIFDVFQRLHSRDDYSGTGIGLAIVKRIVENHEGIISASSSPNEGAIFDIYMPYD